MEKRVLGRGLEALIQKKTEGGAQQIEGKDKVLGFKIQQGITTLSLDKIEANKNQPRKEIDPDALKELAASIKEKGFIQPVLVRTNDKGSYELIAGERRFRAAKMLQLKEVPAIIKDVSDLDSLELSIIENVQRENLNSIDQAKAYKKLSEVFEMTQEDIADTIGKDRTTVANLIRLLKLPEKIQGYVSRGTISMGHARAILGLGKEKDQIRLCTKIVKSDLSVRDTERYAKGFTVAPKKKTGEKDPNLTSLEEKLSEILGTKVNILRSKKGVKIEIEFYSDKDLDRVVTLLKSRG